MSVDLVSPESEQMAQWERRIESLIRAKGGQGSAREFQRSVNVIFHDVEAASYDVVHREMWDSLPAVFHQLAADVERISPAGSQWTLVDVGCGTGLATEFIRMTSLRSRMARLCMVDTSTEMLRRCRERAQAWDTPADFLNGQIDSLASRSADFVLVSSVLHHLPDLEVFCRNVERVLKPGGFFVHVHDPNRGASQSPAFRERSAQLAAIRKQKRAQAMSPPTRIFRAIVRRGRRLFRSEFAADYLDEVNRRLISAGLVRKPLAPQEIWSITDLRVGDLPYSATDGVSARELAAALPLLDQVSIRTYGFYGVLASNLPAELAAEESRLFDQASEDGLFLAGVWVRRSR